MSSVYTLVSPMTRNTARMAPTNSSLLSNESSIRISQYPATMFRNPRWGEQKSEHGLRLSSEAKIMGQAINIPAVSAAAFIESYYRSALNSLLNARLLGVKGNLFPNMHIQVPSRILYICGFKALRTSLDQHIDPNSYENPTTARLALAVCPGIVMTPLSSLLEASNAGHLNPEPMYKRWMRGIVPRAGREIIFGIGLNQMSDYFEAQVQPYFPDNTVTANVVGSVMAGSVSGYFSHVPHNLSTFKLMQPERSYGDLYEAFVDKSVPPSVDKMVASWPCSTRRVTRALFATLFPRGLMIRTNQIVGSFVILNATTNLLKSQDPTLLIPHQLRQIAKI